ncbi:MAG: raffinose/stachyose/melibiose transport system permease protein [Frankiales bacterium]|jgi:raffinose/stachyose/melibiose transport system permease protein|nr:raffinose/stachyose/melibiose transport system permease protein [Frankiales bacterium]
MTDLYAPASSTQPRVLPPSRTRRHKITPFRWLTRALVTVIVVVQVYPLLWLFLTSVKTNREFTEGNPFAIPTSLTFSNYTRAFHVGNLGLNMVNSSIVTLGANVLIVAFGMMGAYAISVLGFKFSGVIRAVFLLGLMVPVQIALVPLFVDYSHVGLLDTYQSMIIPLAGFSLPMSIYLFGAFFTYIGQETYEAASLDGAGPIRIFISMVCPLSLNTILTVVLVNSIFIWNDFIFANTFVLSDGLKTVPLGLQNYIGNMGNVDWTATFAAVCVTITPLLLVFLVLNKAVIYGIESGATKG